MLLIIQTVGQRVHTLISSAVEICHILFPDKTNLTTRLEDPDWFQDLSTNAKTKEEFMFKNCQSRIRGYLYRAETQIRKGSFLMLINVNIIIDSSWNFS